MGCSEPLRGQERAQNQEKRKSQEEITACFHLSGSLRLFNAYSVLKIKNKKWRENAQPTERGRSDLRRVRDDLREQSRGAGRPTTSGSNQAVARSGANQAGTTHALDDNHVAFLRKNQNLRRKNPNFELVVYREEAGVICKVTTTQIYNCI